MYKDETITIGKNIDIKEALKEFEIKNLEQNQVTQVKTVRPQSKMAAFIIKISGGKVGEPKYAEYILLGIAFLMFALSFFFFFIGAKK